MVITTKKVTVFGVGRLGICFALVMEKAGYEVLGVDIFPSYVDAINNKTLKSPEPRVNELLAVSTNFQCTTSTQEGIDFSDVMFVFVDTPCTGGERFYDHSKLSTVIANINKSKKSNIHVIIGCTVIPGYTADIGRHLLRDCPNASLSYNPEFIAQGDIVKGLLQPDMVLIGEGSEEVGAYLEEIYHKHTENEPTICRMSAESAEIAKLSLNCFVTMKISFANLIGDVADKTENADKFKILKCIGADSRVGTKCILPGYGFGGPCFPRDNRAFGKYAKQVNVEPVLSLATDEYNKMHANEMVQAMLKEDLKEYVFEDVCYKSGCSVPIIEESQKLVVAERLAKLGRTCVIRDRPDVILAVEKEYGRIFTYRPY